MTEDVKWKSKESAVYDKCENKRRFFSVVLSYFFFSWDDFSQKFSSETKIPFGEKFDQV